MPRICQISGKKTAHGNTVSHSHIKTKRTFKVNLIRKKIYIPHENRWVSLRISTRMLRTLNKKGLTSLIKKYGQDLKVLVKGKNAIRANKSDTQSTTADNTNKQS